MSFINKLFSWTKTTTERNIIVAKSNIKIKTIWFSAYFNSCRFVPFVFISKMFQTCSSAIRCWHYRNLSGGMWKMFLSTLYYLYWFILFQINNTTSGPHFDAKYFLLYYYYGGMIYLAVRNLDRALYFFEVAITTPSHAVSHIMLESYKKYILVSLLLHGKVKSKIFLGVFPILVFQISESYDSKIYISSCYKIYKTFITALSWFS